MYIQMSQGCTRYTMNVNLLIGMNPFQDRKLFINPPCPVMHAYTIQDSPIDQTVRWVEE